MGRLRIIRALIYYDMMNRPGRGGMYLLSALLEPVALVIVMMIMFTTMGQTAVYGDSMFIFLVTGLIPHFTGTRTVTRVMRANSGWRPKLKIPGIRVTDHMFASTLLELFLFMGVACLLFASTFYIPGLDVAAPHDVSLIALAFGLLALLGLGVGVVNLVIVRFVPLYDLAYGAGQRLLLFLSGLFFVTDFIPPVARELVTLNPLSHGITLFRVGYYGTYPQNTLDIGYMFSFGFTCLVVGLFLERLTRDVDVARNALSPS